MSKKILESSVDLDIDVRAKLIISTYESETIVQNSNSDFLRGNLTKTTVDDNSIVLKISNDGHEGAVEEQTIVHIGLANKTETGWEFEVKETGLIVSRLRFLNLSEHTISRTVTLWNEQKKSIRNVRITAEGKSWGHGNIEPIELEKGNRYVITIGAYSYSVYTKNIESDVSFNTNNISFIGAKYISNKLSMYPIKSSDKLYALPDIEFDTDKKYFKSGYRISDYVQSKSIKDVTSYSISWDAEEPSLTSIQNEYSEDSIQWKPVINGESVSSNRKRFKIKSILTSDGLLTPNLKKIIITFKGFKKSIQESIESNIFFNSKADISSIKKSNKFYDNSLNISVSNYKISKKILDEDVSLNIDAHAFKKANYNFEITLPIFVSGEFIKVLEEDITLSHKVESSTTWKKNEEIFLDYYIESELLKSMEHVWEEDSQYDFSKGELVNTVATEMGLELEHWNKQEVNEDFSQLESSFNFVGNWEKYYFGVDELIDKNRNFVYKSKQISNDQKSLTYFEFNTPINSLDGKLSFEYFVSSEKNYDNFVILVDSKPLVLSGNLGWQTYEGELKSGFHRVEFIYKKDKYYGEYLDRALIDNLHVEYQFLREEGYRISEPINLSDIRVFQTSKVSWIEHTEESNYISLDVSYDNGFTWIPLENEMSLPILSLGDDCKGMNLILRENLYASFNITPILESTRIEIIGFSPINKR